METIGYCTKYQDAKYCDIVWYGPNALP